MAGLLFVVFWAAAYSAAWWGAPNLRKFIPARSPIFFNVIRLGLSIFFWFILFIGVIFRNVLIYAVDGVDVGPPVAPGLLLCAVLFGWRLGPSRETNRNSPSGSFDKELHRMGRIGELKFTEKELSAFGFHQLEVLETFLRDGDQDQLYKVRNEIGQKIGRVYGVDDERAFLEAFREQLHAYLVESASSQTADKTLTVDDPYKIAGEELLSGKVDPTAWAHSLVEGQGEDGQVKAAYVRFRIAQILETQAATAHAELTSKEK